MAARHGTTWLHQLLLGIVKLDKNTVQETRQHFEASQQLFPNYPALRHLALIHQKEGDLTVAKEFYRTAWEQAGNVVPLAVEICQFFQKEQLFHELERFLAQLPIQIVQHERIQLALGEIALVKGQLETVRTILKRRFCTIREGEVLLTDLWFGLHLKEAEIRKGSSLTEEERAEAIAQNPPPYSLDFRMVNG